MSVIYVILFRRAIDVRQNKLSDLKTRLNDYFKVAADKTTGFPLNEQNRRLALIGLNVAKDIHLQQQKFDVYTPVFFDSPATGSSRK